MRRESALQGGIRFSLDNFFADTLDLVVDLLLPGVVHVVDIVVDFVADAVDGVFDLVAEVLQGHELGDDRLDGVHVH